MSEYQYVAFRAIDAPLNEEQLDFMRGQSSRAELTPWSFDNEYHYGSFRGNRFEMLRRGYDFHLHYANFGIRTLMIRFAAGLPNAGQLKPYLGEALQIIKDKSGPGVVLCIESPSGEDYREGLWDLDELIPRLLPLRDEIARGDLRPIYLARLMALLDEGPEDATEPPVPAGLASLTDAQNAMRALYEIDDSLLGAVAQVSPPVPKKIDERHAYGDWLDRQSATKKSQWLVDLMADPASRIRTELLAAFRREAPPAKWPTVKSRRTLAEILATAKEIKEQARSKAAADAARRRTARLKELAREPQRYLREAAELVTERSVASYEKAARLLADLREALAGSNQSALPEQFARKLRSKNPKLHHLSAALRRQGFLAK
ncbi:MAG: hypothetical protein ACOY3P_11830 [Planctomycetota bacterium]